MGERGPAKKPTNLVKLEGNRGKRPLPKNEPKFIPLSSVPTPPSYLTTGAKGIWDRNAKPLFDAGLLMSGDLEAFAALCATGDQWMKASQRLNAKTFKPVIEAKNGVTMANPLVKTQGDLWKQYSLLLKSFGMTPSARAEMGATLAPPVEPEEQGWANF